MTQPHVTSGTGDGPSYFPIAPAGGIQLPFSEAVQLRDTLYVSGQVGIQPDTLKLVAGGLVPEARLAIENMRAILERHGSGLQHVLKCTIFLADIADWPAFNEVYREYFKPPLPARNALAASGLALGAKVELECVAFVPGPAPNVRIRKPQMDTDKKLWKLQQDHRWTRPKPEDARPRW